MGMDSGWFLLLRTPFVARRHATFRHHRDTRSANESMDWERCRPDFEPDGSLRDIYILATTTREWDVTLAVVRGHATSLAFSIDGEARPLPRSASEIFAVSRDCSALLTFTYAAIPFSCHFFGEDEIELSLAPNDISSPDRLNALAEFLSVLGSRIGRDVLLTPENLPARPILRYSVSSGSVDWQPPPA